MWGVKGVWGKRSHPAWTVNGEGWWREVKVRGGGDGVREVQVCTRVVANGSEEGVVESESEDDGNGE